MKRRAACILCSVTVGVLAASAAAQHGHDPLARAREKAKAENQRVLVCLTGGDADLSAELTGALDTYRSLGKTVRYEFQLAAMPGKSQPGEALRGKLRIGELALPTLAILDTEDRVLDTLAADAMTADGGAFDLERVREFLGQHHCEPLEARQVLAAGLAEAKRTARDAFVYLTAPW